MAAKDNRLLVSVHLHRERDKELLAWLEELAAKDVRFSVSSYIRDALYAYMKQMGQPMQRGSDQTEVMARLDWITDTLQHNDLSERITQLADLVQQIVYKINTGVSLTQVQEDVNAALSSEMREHMKRTVVRPGRGQLPKAEDD